MVLLFSGAMKVLEWWMETVIFLMVVYKYITAIVGKLEELEQANSSFWKYHFLNFFMRAWKNNS